MKTHKILALLLAFLFACGCAAPGTSDAPKSSENASLTPPASEDAPLTSDHAGTPEASSPAAPARLDLPKWVRLDGQTLLDVCPTEDGYLLLSRGQGYCYLTPLDAQLAVGEATTLDKDLSDPQAFLQADGSQWLLCYADGGSYAVLRDGEVYVQTENGYFQPQLVWEDGTLYTVQVRRLWIGQTEVAMPDAAPGTNYDVTCVVRVGRQTYALTEAWVDHQAAGQWLCPIDPGTKQLSVPETDFPIAATYTCWDETGTWLVSGSKLYRTDGVNVDLLCDLAALGVNISDMRRILPVGDGTFLVLQSDCLMRVDPDAGDAKELTIGLYQAPYEVDAAIAAFNRAGTGWRVTPRTFRDLETLNLALLNGELDLLCVTDEDAMKNYAVKGLLAPIDDAVTARVLPNLPALCTVDGQCVFLPRTVSLQASSIPSIYLNAGDTDDLDRLIAAIDAHCPETYQCNTQAAALYTILDHCADAWIDWETRTARLDGADFRTALEFCARFESSEQTAAINAGAYNDAGKELVRFNQNLFFGNYHYVVHDDPERQTHGRTLFTFPAAGAQGLGLEAYDLYAIVNGEHVEGGQAFLDYLFSDDDWFDRPNRIAELYEKFPTHLGHLDEILRQAAEEKTGEFAQDPQELRALLLGADHLADRMIGEPAQIIQEEAEAYFQGDCSLDEAVRRIQNRIEIYLAERG